VDTDSSLGLTSAAPTAAPVEDSSSSDTEDSEEESKMKLKTKMEDSDDSEKPEEESEDSAETESGDMNSFVANFMAEKTTNSNQGSFATSPVVVVGALMAMVLGGVLAIAYRHQVRSSSSYEHVAAEEAVRFLDI